MRVVSFVGPGLNAPAKLSAQGDPILRIRLAAGIAAPALFALLSGCSPSAEAPAPAESPAATEAAAATPARDGCKDIATLVAAMDEAEPMASLRTGKFRLGERELDDKFTTDITPAGATCELGVMDGFSPGSGKLYVANCTLFGSGLLDRQAEAEKAKTAFDTARAQLESCLPKDWTSRDGSQPDADTTETMIYESAADAKRAMDASFYAYPVELKKEWSDTLRSGPPGWRVTLNFQKEGAAPTVPAQQQ